MEFLEGDKRKEAIEEWHKEGTRGKLAEDLSEWVRLRPLKRFSQDKYYEKKTDFNNRRALKKLKHARRLYYSSMYILEENSFAVEGYIAINGKENENKEDYVLGLTIISATEFAKYVAEHHNYVEETELLGEKDPLNYVISSSNTIDLMENWVFVPDELTDEAIEKAIAGWYKDKYSYTRGYRGWVPAITVDIERSSID